jgi:hypothetical protein
MKLFLGLVIFILTFLKVGAQITNRVNDYQNSADKLLITNGQLMIGGYGEVHYNQPLSSDTRYNGVLDVHRMVVLVGYNFSSRTQLISEIEFEHVSEVYIEQAFLQHSVNNLINFRAGLLLIPMGIVNEYHEPTAFNGVERPLIDSKISPTTWREIGIGLNGNSIDASLKYQAYLVNGFNGYNGKATLSGKNGLRNGRQKGAESYISSPNFSAKVEYYGISGLNLGLSGYVGNTQSTLFNGIDRNNKSVLAKADSSVVGISMVGADARYTKGGLHLRGQFYYTALSNTGQYNTFTAVNGVPNDLGRAMVGYYLEAGYSILKHSLKSSSELIPFVRFEKYDTHFATAGNLSKNLAWNNKAITTGITFKLNKGVVVKTDLQFLKSEAATNFSKVLNVGFGVMF